MSKNLLPGLLLALLFLVFSNSCFAVTCNAANTTSQSVVISNNINIADNQPAGTVVWQSANLSVAITCVDTDGHPQGENAYIYVNPDNNFTSYLQGTGLALYIRVQGGEYGSSAGQKIPLPFTATSPNTSNGCTGHHSNNHGNSNCAATKGQFTLNFSLILKRTSEAITRQSPSGSSPKIFVVDGEQGIRVVNHKAANFGPTLTGLTQITRISCNPVVTIVGPDGHSNSVHFGKINAAEAHAGQYANNFKHTFNVVVNDNTNQCSHVDFRLSFSTTNSMSNNATLILPANDSHFGIAITPTTTLSPLTLGTAIDFGGPLNAERTKTFDALIYWITNQPKPGPFSATATATITFK